MTKHLIKLVSLLLSSVTVTAQNLTQTSVNKANEIIEQVVLTYGGADKLNQLNSVSIDFETSNMAVNLCRKPGPPWDINYVKGSSL